MRLKAIVFAAVLVLVAAFRSADAAPTCYVVLDGDIVTNYYNSVADAVGSIGTGTGVVTMIADDAIMTSNKEMRVDVVGKVTIVSDGGDRTIARGVHYAQTNYSMFYVARVNMAATNATLTLGSPSMSGTLTLDGGSFSNTGASIILCYRGTVNLYDGVTLKNNISGDDGSAIYNEATVNMYGGTIVSNVSYGLGAGVDNEGFWGQPVTFNMYGGTIAHNRANDGGNKWGYPTGYGGGVANQGAATANLYGGTIANNEAEHGGGGVFSTANRSNLSHTPGALNLTGGTISDNAVLDVSGHGAGVFSDKPLTMAGAAGVDAGNDVYLSNSVITVTNALSQPGVVAMISSASTTSGTPVVRVSPGAGVTLNDVLGSFDLVPGWPQTLAVDTGADAIVRSGATCHVVMDGQTTTNYYAHLVNAIRAIGTGTGVVTMIANDQIVATNLDQRINVTGTVSIVSDGGDHTISRSPMGVSNSYSMIYVARFAGGPTNAVLNLGSPAMSGTLTFDGGAFPTFGSSVILHYRGTLNMYDGVTIKNSHSGLGGAGVYNEATFNMYGGTIVSNVAYGTGGGVRNAGYWGQQVKFNMYGGTIAHNSSLNDVNDLGGYGGGVIADGTTVFNMMGGSIHDNEAEYAGGGIESDNDYYKTNAVVSVVNLMGGTVSDNQVSGVNGRGNGVYSEGLLTMAGAAGVDAGNDVYLSNSVITVTNALSQPGVVAMISSASTTSGTPVVRVSPGAGVTLNDVLGSFDLVPGSGQELVVYTPAGAIVRASPFEAWLVRRGHDFNDPDFAPGNDVDGDGATTWEEYIADTEPADADSILLVALDVAYGTNYVDVVGTSDFNEVETNRVFETKGLVFSWPSASGRVYDVESAALLSPSSWAPVLVDVAATPPANAITNLYGSLPTNSVWFYRARARLDN